MVAERIAVILAVIVRLRCEGGFRLHESMGEVHDVFMRRETHKTYT